MKHCKMRNSPKGIIFLTLLFLSVASVYGMQTETQETEKIVRDIEEFSLEELLNVQVISASKISQKTNEAPSVISVITEEQIHSYGWQSLNDILFTQPGFFPSHDYDRVTVGSRGLFEGWNNNHLLLLIDGVPYNDNLYGSAYTTEITPLFFVKSLEIIRGPGSALYGSNATNGVLSINTLSAKHLNGKTLAQFRLGTQNTQIYDFCGGENADDFSYIVGFNVLRTSGNEYNSYDGSYRTNADGNLSQFKIRDDRNSIYGFGKIEGKNAFAGLNLQLHYQAWNFQTGHGWLWMIPDFDEAMQESRIFVTLSYTSPATKNWNQEYVVRYQSHQLDWNMRYYPNGALNNFYPSGTWEYLKTDAQDIFARAQWTFSIKKEATVLAGLEGSILFYNGDKEHYSNTDLNDEGGFTMDNGTEVPSYEGWYAPFPQNSNRSFGPWFAWILDKPVKNIGLYSQFTSGTFLGSKLKATLGLRADFQFFTFNALDKAGTPEEHKSFSQISPRLGLVYLASDNLSVKALAGRAFRAPSPTELFGANTWTIASNLRELKPETITTLELAMDWKLNANINWRLNFFYTQFANQIAYSVTNNNLSTNMYTLTNAGMEADFLFSFKRLNGFLNYSFYKRLDETIFDTAITANENELTWAPAHTLNLGLRYKVEKFAASLQGHYQGKVKRRASDFTEPLFVPLRPEHVKEWLSIDARLLWEVTPILELAFNATNITNSQNYVIKNFSYPFDYRMNGRRIFAEIKIKL